MFPAQQGQGRGRAVSERGVVVCEKCHAPILIEKPGSVAIEFSVPCKKCGHRGIYFKRMIVTEEAAEQRKQPR